jgi:hypothetical protein
MNFMATLPTLQFTSPYGNYLLPVSAAAFGNNWAAAVDVAECTLQGPLAAPTEPAPMQPDVQSLQLGLGPQCLEGHCCSADGFSAGLDSMAAERPVVVLQLSSVLADACSQAPSSAGAAAAQATSTGPAPPPPFAPPFEPPSFAAPSLFETSTPPLPPPAHAPGLLPLPEGGVEEEELSLPSEPPVLSWADCSDLPSLGSVGHDAGRCKPCAFFHKEGCQNAASCRFCHLCEPGEKRKRQKEKKEQQEQKINARKFRQAAPRASWS